MTRQELLDDIQARLTALWSAIQTRQANYLAANQRYFQGRISHTLTPADGLDLAPDRTLDHPTDQAHTWADWGGLPATMRFAIRLDVYSGPLGSGYVATVWVRWQGEVWTRSRQHGPESWRNSGWSRVREEA